MEHREERYIVGIKGIHKRYKLRTTFLFVTFKSIPLGCPEFCKINVSINKKTDFTELRITHSHLLYFVIFKILLPCDILRNVFASPLFRKWGKIMVSLNPGHMMNLIVLLYSY